MLSLRASGATKLFSKRAKDGERGREKEKEKELDFLLRMDYLEGGEVMTIYFSNRHMEHLYEIFGLLEIAEGEDWLRAKDV